MCKFKCYHVGDSGLVEGEALGRITVYLAADFDRVTAERDALQERLTVQDQRVDELEAAGSEMLRIAAISNKGSNAYNRAIVNLHYAINPIAEAASHE